MRRLAPELARERAAIPSENFHKWTDVQAMLSRHVEGGLCSRCAGTENGAESCYIYGSLLQFVNFKMPWNEHGPPAKIDCKPIPMKPGAPSEACAKTMQSLHSKGIIEPTTWEEAHTLAPAFMVPRSQYNLNAEEKAATQPAAYDVRLVNQLAKRRGHRMAEEMLRGAGHNKAYTRAVFEAAQAQERGEPKWRSTWPTSRSSLMRARTGAA